ncbi:MAG: 50S ribosomal protein L29 [Oscillospiraceae bacterium]
MKAAELRDMKTLELTKKLADLKQELFNLRFQHAINQLDNPQRLVVVKREIARVKTVMTEQALAAGTDKVEAAEKSEKAKKADKAVEADK